MDSKSVENWIFTYFVFVEKLTYYYQLITYTFS